MFAWLPTLVFSKLCVSTGYRRLLDNRRGSCHFLERGQFLSKAACFCLPHWVEHSTVRYLPEAMRFSTCSYPSRVKAGAFRTPPLPSFFILSIILFPHHSFLTSAFNSAASGSCCNCKVFRFPSLPSFLLPLLSFLALVCFFPSTFARAPHFIIFRCVFSRSCL